MAEDLDFPVRFPKEKNGMYIVYELYTFDNLFQLLLICGFNHEKVLEFVLFNCSLSALVFQERIHNKKYRKLSAKDALPVDLAARKAQLIYDFMSIIDEEEN